MTNIAAQQPHWQPDTTGPGYGKRSVFLDLARRDLERGGTGAGAERVFSALVDTGDASLGRRPAWLKAWAALASCVSCVCTGIEQTARGRDLRLTSSAPACAHTSSLCQEFRH